MKGFVDAVVIAEGAEVILQPVGTAGVAEAIRLGMIGFDTVKLLIIAGFEHRPAHLALRPGPGIKCMIVAQIVFWLKRRERRSPA